MILNFGMDSLGRWYNSSMNTTAIKPERDITSIGCLCQRLQASYRRIERAAEALGIVPAMRINGVVHFDGEQEEAIRRQLQGEGEAEGDVD